MKVTMCRLATVAVLACATAAWAGPWANPAGAGDDFTYANGGDVNGLFGEPFVAGNTFFFANANFQVNASNGGQQTQSDMTFFDVMVNPGLFFSEMSVTAFGSYTVVGEGSYVDLDSGLSLTENVGLLRNWTGPLSTSPTFPVATPSSGIWSGQALVDVTFEFPSPADSIHVELSSLIDAVAGAIGSSEINVQYEDLTITFGIVPEPASLVLLGLGGLSLLRRRR